MTRSIIAAIAGVFIAAVSAICVAIALHEHQKSAPETGDPAPRPTGILPGSVAFPKNVQFACPGIQDPPFIAARDAALDPVDEVIGVTVAGRHRAYLIAALSEMTGHVVNDLVGDTPVTVTYCDRIDCAQVFTSDVSGKALEIGTAGWDSELLLNLDGRIVRQKTGEAVSLSKTNARPWPRLPFVRMKWKDWHALHPDSEVYVGPKPGQRSDER